MATVARDAGVRRYGDVAIAFHWTIAVLVVANLLIGLGHEAIPPLGALMPAHKAIGITVLALTAGRVLWRLTHRPPPLPASVPIWQRRTSHIVHWSLYALMVLLPLTGWAMVSGGEVRRPLDWFGLFPIPYLPASGAAAERAHGAHEALGFVMLALVALHVAAALYHHYVRRDGLLHRMNPEPRLR